MLPANELNHYITNMPESPYHQEYRKAARNFQLKKFGCVCSALSSIAQVPLTTEQEEMRMAQIFEYEEAKRRIFHLEFTQEVESFELQQLHKELRTLNDVQIMTFISTIQGQSETPAGNQLSRMEVRRLELSPKDIRRFCDEGSQVMISCVLNNNGHAMHVEPKGRKFIEVSGNRQEIKLDNKKYPAFVFTPSCRKK